MPYFPLPAAALLLSLALAAAPAGTRAEGMIPESTVVIVDEALGEVAIKVTNTDATTALLYVTLQDVPEDPHARVFVTPPVSRVEPGQAQLVRFIIDPSAPLQVQRLKRVIFEGIGQAGAPAAPGEATVGVSIRQNLPVLLHPKGLAANREPWRGLVWQQQGDELLLSNPTPYVVRLAQELHLQPGGQGLLLPRSYVLPGDHIRLPMPAADAPHAAVRLYPATVYGFSVASYEAPVQAGTP